MGGTPAALAGAADPGVDLVRRHRAGDPTAFEDLVRRHGARMLAVARRLLGNSDDAEDAVQDALMSAFRSLSSFEGRAALSSWLHRIVVNHALMRMRKQRCHDPKSIAGLLPSFTSAYGHHACPPRPWPGAPDLELEREDLRALVRDCIEKLPDSFRNAVLLRDIEGMDLEDIAQLLHVSHNAAKIRVHRGRQALRAILEPHLYGDAS